MIENVHCLEWDSKFFDKKIGYVNDVARLTHKDTFGYELVTCKINSQDKDLINSLELLDFRFVEGELTYELNLDKYSSTQPDYISSKASVSDIEQLQRVAKSAFVGSRYREPWFTLDQNQAFYQKWIENAVLKQFDDICLVVKVDGVIRGFVSAKVNDNTCIVGLTAVSENFRGRGIAKQLIRLVISYAVDMKCNTVLVATQTSNIAASNLYTSCGFLLSSSKYWFYKGQS